MGIGVPAITGGGGGGGGGDATVVYVDAQDATNLAAAKAYADLIDEGIQWQFATSTVSGDPGAGYFRLDNATPSAVTAIYISETNKLGANVASLLALWASFSPATPGRVLIRGQADRTEWAAYSVGARTDNGAWDSIVLTYVDGSGTFSADDVIELSFQLPANVSAFLTQALAAATYLALAGGTMSGAIAMGGFKVTGLGTPTTAGDAVDYTRDLVTARRAKARAVSLAQSIPEGST